MSGVFTKRNPSLLFQSVDRLVIGPTLDLLITLSGPARVLFSGETFNIRVTIDHDIGNSNHIQVLEVFFAYQEEYLMPPDNFTALFGNGNFKVFGK